MMQMVTDQHELVTSTKAQHHLGWRFRHLSFTDTPDQYDRARKAAQPTT
ncbi:hypothetical protein [Streptomyces sp. NPDC051662]